MGWLTLGLKLIHPLPCICTLFIACAVPWVGAEGNFLFGERYGFTFAADEGVGTTTGESAGRSSVRGRLALRSGSSLDRFRVSTGSWSGGRNSERGLTGLTTGMLTAAAGPNNSRESLEEEWVSEWILIIGILRSECFH